MYPCLFLSFFFAKPDHVVVFEEVIGGDFFESGGDSLLAAQFIRSLNRSLDRAFSIADLYENPTLDWFNRLLEVRQETDTWHRLVSFNREATAPALFFFYGNGQVLSNHLGAGRPVHWLIHGKAGTVVPIVSCAAAMREQPSGPFLRRLEGVRSRSAAAFGIKRTPNTRS